MGARDKLKPKEGYLKDTNGTSSRTALQNVKALWETHSISVMRLRNKSKGGKFSVRIRPYFQISSPALQLIGHKGL